MIARLVPWGWCSSGCSGGRAIFSESAASVVPDRSEIGPYLGGSRVIFGVVAGSETIHGTLKRVLARQRTPPRTLKPISLGR